MFPSTLALAAFKSEPPEDSLSCWQNWATINDRPFRSIGRLVGSGRWSNGYVLSTSIPRDGQGISGFREEAEHYSVLSLYTQPPSTLKYPNPPLPTSPVLLSLITKMSGHNINLGSHNHQETVFRTFFFVYILLLRLFFAYVKFCNTVKPALKTTCL